MGMNTVMKKRILSASRIMSKPLSIDSPVRFKFVKMDARYTGYPSFKYMVEVISLHKAPKIKAFNEIRDWCIETWGMSVEREQYLYMEDMDPEGIKLNPAWCWHTEDHKMNIYLRDEAEKMWTELRWK